MTVLKDRADDAAECNIFTDIFFLQLKIISTIKAVIFLFLF